MSKLFLITGPSGVGKTTVAYKLLNEIPELEKLVTFTTRVPRPNEKNGVDYNFVTREEFEAKLNQGEFFENAEVYGNLYGNSRTELQKIWDKGKTPIMVLDIQGVDTIKEIMPEATSIFIKPDTMENLKTRIKQRPMSDEAFQKRWETATAEMSLADKYDYQIMNAEGKLVEAVNAVKEILNK